VFSNPLFPPECRGYNLPYGPFCSVDGLTKQKPLAPLFPSDLGLRLHPRRQRLATATPRMSLFRPPVWRFLKRRLLILPAISLGKLCPDVSLYSGLRPFNKVATFKTPFSPLQSFYYRLAVFDCRPEMRSIRGLYKRFPEAGSVALLGSSCFAPPSHFNKARFSRPVVFLSQSLFFSSPHAAQ